MPDCDLCGGRGWVIAPDGGNGTACPCVCRSRRPLAERLAAAGVWEAHRHCTRETWHGAWPAAQLEAFGTTRHLCTIIGPVGTGKTHLATAILGEWLAGGGHGRWRETSTTLEEIKRATAAGSAGAQIDDLKLGRGLLVLDDLLSQQGTDWTEFLLSHVLRYRQGRYLPTIVTANVTDLVDLDRLEPRLGSRCGAGIVIALTGADRRTAKGAACAAQARKPCP